MELGSIDKVVDALTEGSGKSAISYRIETDSKISLVRGDTRTPYLNIKTGYQGSSWNDGVHWMDGGWTDGDYWENSDWNNS